MARRRRLMVTWHDPQGLPRAFALGPAHLAELIRSRSEAELAAYRREKRAAGDPLADAAFYRRERLLTD